MGRFFRWFGLPGNLVLTTLISIYGIVLACVFRTPERIICAFAMLFSSLGDIILMDYKPITKRLPFRGFTAGALTFGLSHLIYASAFLTVIIISGFDFFNHGFILGCVLFCASLVALTFMNRRNRTGKTMIVLPLCYLLLIAGNCAVIFSCSVSRGAFGFIAAAGAVSFFISDMFIALNVVGGLKIKHSDDIIWWFYPIGQILLLAGA